MKIRKSTLYTCTYRYKENDKERNTAFKAILLNVTHFSIKLVSSQPFFLNQNIVIWFTWFNKCKMLWRQVKSSSLKMTSLMEKRDKYTKNQPTAKVSPFFRKDGRENITER